MFEPGIAYSVNAEGAILTRAGRREAAKLAATIAAQERAEAEVEAAGKLPRETLEAIQAEHDNISPFRLRRRRSAQEIGTRRLSRRRRQRSPRKDPRLSFTSGAAPFFERLRRPGYAPAKQSISGSLAAIGGLPA